MAKMGRPKLPPKERSSHVIALRVTPAEYKTLENSAAKAKLSIGEYIRTKLNLRGDK
jgi:predicted HicB family RNase H-like nuclease